MDRTYNNSLGQVITVRLNQTDKSFTINNGSINSVFYQMVDDGEIVWTNETIWDVWFENDPLVHKEITDWYWSVVKG
jgi:hypothetical protein